MPNLSLATRNAVADLTGPEDPLDLKQLREEIDRVDDAILKLIEQRAALARQVGHAKSADPAGVLNLKPAREAHVLSRLIRKARPASRRVVLAIWRELMSAGLAAQGQVEIAIWGGGDRRVQDGALRRFGASADYSPADRPEAALERARTGNTVAVLALQSDSPWWTQLASRYPALWICEALDGARGPGEPVALAVARVDPKSLAGGRTFLLSMGGDAGLHAPATRLLGFDTGARLYVTDKVSNAEITAQDRHRGVLGRAPVFCLSAKQAVGQGEAT